VNNRVTRAIGLTAQDVESWTVPPGAETDQGCGDGHRGNGIISTWRPHHRRRGEDVPPTSLSLRSQGGVAGERGGRHPTARHTWVQQSWASGAGAARGRLDPEQRPGDDQDEADGEEKGGDALYDDAAHG